MLWPQVLRLKQAFREQSLNLRPAVGFGKFQIVKPQINAESHNAVEYHKCITENNMLYVIRDTRLVCTFGGFWGIQKKLVMSHLRMSRPILKLNDPNDGRPPAMSLVLQWCLDNVVILSHRREDHLPPVPPSQKMQDWALSQGLAPYLMCHPLRNVLSEPGEVLHQTWLMPGHLLLLRILSVRMLCPSLLIVFFFFTLCWI